MDFNHKYFLAELNFLLEPFWLVDIGSGQKHNFLVGWSGKCDASGPRDQSDRITQISKQRKNKQGKISQPERQLFENGEENISYLIFHIRVCCRWGGGGPKNKIY